MVELTFFSFAVSAAFGFAIGVICPVLGIGGGAFLVPFFILALGLPAHCAVASSLVATVALSNFATAYNLRKNLVNIRIGVLMSVFASLGAFMSVYAALGVPEKTLRLLFSGLLFVIAFFMFRKKREEGKAGRDGEMPGNGCFYFDAGDGKKTRYILKNVKFCSLLSFFGGGLSGFFGIGGGIVHVPVINLVAGAPAKIASATSSFIIGMSACAGALVFYKKGLMQSWPTAAVLLGVLTGSFFGAKALHKVRSGKIKAAFAVLLVVVAFILLGKS